MTIQCGRQDEAWLGGIKGEAGGFQNQHLILATKVSLNYDQCKQCWREFYKLMLVENEFSCSTCLNINYVIIIHL